ncbi:MAG: hypothetical protein H6667_11255 [Ardenticatenaceae bacterium]|nr:hypothetical protein [Ardenticatenaceae bacterium]
MFTKLHPYRRGETVRYGRGNNEWSCFRAVSPIPGRNFGRDDREIRPFV